MPPAASIWSICTIRTTTRPAASGIFIADVLGGTHAFGAIQAALYQREKHRQGQHIDVSMLEAMVGMLVYETQARNFRRSAARSTRRCAPATVSSWSPPPAHAISSN
jgi:crotonobetainyl-CoA:carnitine CoA-transferase CaiB-like acyl-CoA transferase